MPVSIHESLDPLLKPLLDALPLDRAMTRLVVEGPSAHTQLTPTVESILHNTLFKSNPTLAAGLWLYVDELDKSHVVSQSIDSTTGSYWHGIMHRREGDFSNSHYWFRRVGSHPAMERLAHYDPHAFIDQAEHAHRQNQSPERLVTQQREEWLNLMRWCAQQPDGR
ncbi:MAG: hypothetical protein GC164_03230 [Phycisphaera sp.]|nr:hypothetical protein [Phycisphaera sp.]